jgi:hypothetical protein
MSNEGDLSHRQEREQKKEQHAHPTRGKYLSSKHLTWAMVAGRDCDWCRSNNLDLPSAGVAWPRLNDQGGDLSDYPAALQKLESRT